jgi:hypothetical protein
MNTQILNKLTEIINLKAVCEQTGLKTNTINAKIKNNRQLDVDEAKAISNVLAGYGFEPTFLPTGEMSEFWKIRLNL